jgi:mannan endo-1,4-beta-mannosidase
MTYLYWTNGGSYINNGDPAHPWPEFADFAAQFYNNREAMALYTDYVRLIVSRTNKITGKPYKADPTLMAWQLCNEPRPSGDRLKVDAGMPAYLKWAADTAALIRSLDDNHLVSLGSEGLIGVNDKPEHVVAGHQNFDYITAHIWPQNWSWVDPADIAGTYDAGAAKVKDYIRKHVEIANYVGKPLVFEEFGFPRDGALFDPGTATSYRDQFYRLIFDSVEEAVRSGMTVAGSNFWAWSGSGRALHEDHRMLRGETNYVGDPPHEPQGWYGVFNNDISTQALIKAHAQRLSILSKTI